MKKIDSFYSIKIYLINHQCPNYNKKLNLSTEQIYNQLPIEIKKYVDDDFKLEDLMKDVFNNGLSFIIRTFGIIIILCLITIFINTIVTRGRANSKVMSFISSSALSLTTFNLIFTEIDLISAYADRLSQLMGGFTFFSNSVYLFAGYVSTAATSTAWLQLIMNFIKDNVNTYLIPLLKILCGISLANTTICKERLGNLIKLIKNTFIWICTIIITLISTVMSVQTSVTKITDVAGVQTIKFAASQAFPIVGGLVSESVRNVAGAANSAKTAGGCIVLSLIAIIALFPLTSLLGIKIGLSLSLTVCDMINCNEVSEVVNSAISLLNFMLAVIGILASVFAISAVTFMLQNINVVS